MRGWQLAVAVVVMLGASAAEAHERPRSRSSFTVGPAGAVAIVEVPRKEASALLRSMGASSELTSALVLWSGNRACTPIRGSFTALPASERDLRFSWRVSCALAPESFAIESKLSSHLPGHVHLASVAGFGATQYFVLGADSPKREWRQSFDGAFFTLGFEHVAVGLDHLLFLLLLAALATSAKEAMGWIVGFSLGHAVSIALVAVSLVRADSRLVEVAIALSIALAAAEVGWEELRLRRIAVVAITLLALVFAGLGAAILIVGVALAALSLGNTRSSAARMGFASLFGLVHGLGFAGGLLPALPNSDILWPLVQFNVGVEVAQLLIGLGLIAIVVAGRRMMPRSFGPVVAAASLAAACYWLVARGLAL